MSTAGHNVGGSAASPLARQMRAPTRAEQRAYWDERWEATQRPNAWQTRRGKALLEILDGLRLDQPRMLDLGCATGWFVAQLSARGSAMGIDLSPAAIAIAKASYPGLEFIAGDLYSTNLGRASFDVIVCQEVIAHVDDQRLLIEQIDGALKPGGYLLITTVNKFAIDRTFHPADPDAHIKKWLSRRDFLDLLRPRFSVQRDFTIIPIGNRGVLRFANSHKVNQLLGPLLGYARLERIKERLGFGYTRIAVARKPAA